MGSISAGAQGAERVVRCSCSGARCNCREAQHGHYTNPKGAGSPSHTVKLMFLYVTCSTLKPAGRVAMSCAEWRTLPPCLQGGRTHAVLVQHCWRLPLPPTNGGNGVHVLP